VSSTRDPGRVAGFWYLFIVVFGPLRLVYIPHKLFDYGNAAATANNIAAHNCFAYVIGCFTGIFAPQYQGTVFNYLFPIMFGEIAFMLWLVIKGAKPQLLETAA
jgi:hypothetical protein